MPPEIEPRYILPGIEASTAFSSPQRIIQGYFPSSPHQTFRVRSTDGRDFTMTQKIGFGLERDEQNCEITEVQYQFLLGACPYMIEKTRYDREGWSVDMYHGPLHGLVCMERELANVEDSFTLPTWINSKQAIEVTNSLTNYDLARLAIELQRNPIQGMSVYEFLRALVQLPMVVITGGPCSGKSKALGQLKREFGDRMHFVPEAATIVICQVGVAFPAGDPFAVARFQKTIASVQKSFEFLVKTEAVRLGKSAVVLDRGDVDCAAYLPNGLDDFEAIMQVTRAYAYARYNGVICLSVPPSHIYEQFSQDNPARTEAYPLANELGLKIEKVWGNHPNYHYIPNENSWEEKYNKVRAKFEQLIA
jgi:CYTH domain-containing protein/predicted ATPase